MIVLVEGIVYLLLLIALARWRPLRAPFTRLHPGHKALLGGFLALVLIAQLGQLSRRSFPFVAWRMFTGTVNSTEVPFYEYRGTLRSGETVVLRPARLVPSLKNGRFVGKLKSLAARALSKEESRSRTEHRRRYSETLVALGGLYNRENPDDPLASIQVYRCSVDLRDYVDDSSIRRTAVWRVDVD